MTQSWPCAAARSLSGHGPPPARWTLHKSDTIYTSETTNYRYSTVIYIKHGTIMALRGCTQLGWPWAPSHTLDIATVSNIFFGTLDHQHYNYDVWTTFRRNACCKYWFNASNQIHPPSSIQPVVGGMSCPPLFRCILDMCFEWSMFVNSPISTHFFDWPNLGVMLVALPGRQSIIPELNVWAMWPRRQMYLE